MSLVSLKIFISLFSFIQIYIKYIVNVFNKEKNLTLKFLSLRGVVYKGMCFFSTSFVTTIFGFV